jgi:calcium-dependent protein kinase
MGTSCVKSKTKGKSSQQGSESKSPVSRNDRESLSEKLGLFILYDSNLTSDILNYYDFGPIIGHGSFGNVRIATRKLLRARQQFAVKSIPKSRVKSDIRLLQRELRILKSVDHPNIIKLHDVYEDPKFLHLVQEYCSGGELFEKIVDRGNYTENEASSLMYKLLHAINHLHNQNICHRDIKPENILYKSKEANSEIKLIDFGLSYKFGEAEEMHTIVGTSYYVAPEVLEKRYGMECDIWSLGVILYLLLAGKPPFAGSDKNDIFNKIQNCEYSMDDEVWRSVSSEAKDIIRKLICRNPKDRLTAAQAMEHP